MSGNDKIIRITLITIAIGVWALVYQNATTEQNVYVKGGRLNANVSGSVDIDNTLDINIESVNGHSDIFLNNPSRGEKNKYYLLPVSAE
jgi:hypothetical protein